MLLFDNITEFVNDDLKKELCGNSKVAIAAACFSIYAYQELKNNLRISKNSDSFSPEPISKVLALSC